MHSQSLHPHDQGDYYKDRSAPIRHYGQPQLDDHNPFTSGAYMPRGFQPEGPAQQEANRRAFPPATYQASTNMYDWQHNVATNGPSPTNFFMSNSPQVVVPLPTPYHAVPPLAQDGIMPQRLGHSQFDIPAARYDSTPALGNQLRTGSLHHPHQVPQDFRDYLHDGGPYGPHDPEMKDEHNIHSG